MDKSRSADCDTETDIDVAHQSKKRCGVTRKHAFLDKHDIVLVVAIYLQPRELIYLALTCRELMHLLLYNKDVAKPIWMPIASFYHMPVTGPATIAIKGSDQQSG